MEVYTELMLWLVLACQGYAIHLYQIPEIGTQYEESGSSEENNPLSDENTQQIFYENEEFGWANESEEWSFTNTQWHPVEAEPIDSMEISGSARGSAEYSGQYSIGMGTFFLFETIRPYTPFLFGTIRPYTPLIYHGMIAPDPVFHIPLEFNTESHWNTTIPSNGTFPVRPEMTASPLNKYALCGYPAICAYDVCTNMNKSTDPLFECEIRGGRAILSLVIIILAISIIGGNFLLPIIVWRCRAMRTQHNLIKVSLSVSDMTVGLILLFSVIPNMVNTMNMTEEEIILEIQATENSGKAITVGSALTLAAQTSILHLMYMSIERFIAIQYPFWHRARRRRTLLIQILGLWLFSIFMSYIPAAFADYFAYKYAPVLFVFILVPRDTGSKNIHGILYLVLTFALPFLITVFLTIVTLVLVWTKLKSTAHMKRSSTKRSRDDSSEYTKGSRTGSNTIEKHKKIRLKPEIAVLKTTMIMIAGFCSTLLPFIVVMSSFYGGYYNCSNYTLSYTVSFLTCTSSSFINVLIYSIRDPKFRSEVKTIFKCENKRK